MDTLTIIGLISSLLGIITGFGYFYDKIHSTKNENNVYGKPLFSAFKYSFYIRLSWKQAQKAAEKISNEIIFNKEYYDLIIGIGRGGAIFGAMLSYALNQIPIVVIDRVYEWRDNKRKEDMLIKPRIPGDRFKKILLVAGEAHSGNTIQQFYNYIFKSTGSKPDVCAFYKQEGCTVGLKYYGMAGRTFKLMPWQDNRYIRDSRSREEYTKLINEKMKFEKESQCDK